VLTVFTKDMGYLEVEITPRVIASLRHRFPIGPFGFDGPMTHG
jgi:hypothetical protein